MPSAIKTTALSFSALPFSLMILTSDDNIFMWAMASSTFWL